MPQSGTRFVDVFSGRGAVTWHVMTLLDYKRYWINALGTYDFFKELRWIGPAPAGVHLTIKNRTKRVYKEAKRETLGSTIDALIPELQTAGAQQIVDLLKRGREISTEKELKQPLSPVKESYLSFQGGTYNSSGLRGTASRGGVSRDGMRRSFQNAGLLLEKNWKRVKLTGLDYREVLEQCKPSDMVYL